MQRIQNERMQQEQNRLLLVLPCVCFSRMASMLLVDMHEQNWNKMDNSFDCITFLSDSIRVATSNFKDIRFDCVIFDGSLQIDQKQDWFRNWTFYITNTKQTWYIIQIWKLGIWTIWHCLWIMNGSKGSQLRIAVTAILFLQMSSLRFRWFDLIVVWLKWYCQWQMDTA